jgi:hypothetical protein
LASDRLGGETPPPWGRQGKLTIDDIGFLIFDLLEKIRNQQWEIINRQFLPLVGKRIGESEEKKGQPRNTRMDAKGGGRQGKLTIRLREGYDGQVFDFLIC